MNSEHNTKTGGASITPSARPSIHSHRGECDFSLGERDTMEQYGLYIKQRERKSDVNLQSPATHPSTSNEVGRDEVDNSKFLHPSSPLVAKRLTQKRKSFDDAATYSDDSDNSSKLPTAKSLPTYFELNSSNEFGNWPSPNSLDRSTSSTQNMRNLRENDNSTASNYESSFGTSRVYNSSHNTSYNNSVRVETKSNVPTVLMVFLVAIVAVVLAVYNGNLPTSLPEFVVRDTYNTAKLYEDLNSLGGKYKITDDTILQLKNGISTIFKREDTGSFVLAYKSSNRDFDHDKFNSLVNTIAAAASKYLRNDSALVQHIVLDGSKLKMRSHSELINRYRDDVGRNGVMLVRELDEVPSALAMAFHYYCDEYDPLVKKSAIFFTLDMAKCSRNPAEQYPTHAQIEKCLKQKWSGVPVDNISPLLNRVVSIVVNVSGD